MRRSSARDGQIEPFPALAAVGVVALALAVYAGAFESAVPDATGRNVANPVADVVERSVTVGGVVRPGRVDGVNQTGPEGYRTNVTLISGEDRFTAGPTAPNTADTAIRRVSVRRGPGDVVPGTLEVHVWT